MEFARAILLGMAVLCVASVRSAATPITVFAAASLADALKDLGAKYERRSGDRVFFSFGASSILARQIEEGAPADIFFSADEAKMDVLENKDLIVERSRKSRLSNALVIVVAAQNGAPISAPRDLANASVRRIALAEPKTVPAGIYARQFLASSGLWKQIDSKVIPTENVRGALAAVESGNADAAIVYKTDAAISHEVKIAYEVPAEQGPKISYPLAILRESKHPEAAQGFWEYLDSKEAATVFRTFGFIVLP